MHNRVALWCPSPWHSCTFTESLWMIMKFIIIKSLFLFSTWSSGTLNWTESMTLLYSLATFKLAPADLKFCKSDSNVSNVLGLWSPRLSRGIAISSWVIWHHKQQWRPEWCTRGKFALYYSKWHSKFLLCFNNVILPLWPESPKNGTRIHSRRRGIYGSPCLYIDTIQTIGY